MWWYEDCPTWHYHLHRYSFASLGRYMVVVGTYSPGGIQVALKYCSISYKKFSKSFALHTPPKGLGLGPHTFVETISISLDVPWIAYFNSARSPPSDYIWALNSSIVALILVITPTTFFSLNLSCPSTKFLWTPSWMKASSILAKRVDANINFQIWKMQCHSISITYKMIDRILLIIEIIFDTMLLFAFKITLNDIKFNGKINWWNKIFNYENEISFLIAFIISHVWGEIFHEGSNKILIFYSKTNNV